jgi:hypothetical protein
MNPFEDPERRDPFPVEEELHGPLLEWLARDARDHIALFTAIAPVDVAPEVLDRLEEHRRALAAILVAPPTTRSVFGPPVGNERGERWRALVERGLFVFAAHRSGGPYWIAEAPQQPISARELPLPARELVSHQPAVALPFKHVASLMPEAVGQPTGAARRP